MKKLSRGAILLLLLSMLVPIMIRRYDQLQIHVNNTHFFNRTGVLLSAVSLNNDNRMDQSPSPKIIHLSQDPLPNLDRHFPQIPKKNLLDPFKPDRENNRFLDLHYGVVHHAVPVKSPFGRTGDPAWFVWSAGPSQAAPDIIHSSSGSIPVYEYKTPPFDASNGLKSQGYLYMDSNGIRLGKIP